MENVFGEHEYVTERVFNELSKDIKQEFENLLIIYSAR